MSETESFESESFNHGRPLSFVGVSTNGSIILSGDFNGSAKVWDRSEYKLEPLSTFTPGEDIRSLALNEDASIVISGGEDGTIRLWQRDGTQVGEPFSGHLGRVTSLGMSDDGTTFVSGGEDGTVRPWDFRWENWLQSACRRLMDHSELRNSERGSSAFEARETCKPYI